MRKLKSALVCLFFVVAVFAIMSCKTAPNAPTPLTTEEAFEELYDKYFGEVILDGASFYTVKRGDTMSKIAYAFYNDGFYYPVIMLASNSVVLDPDKIEPGMKLTIPNLPINLLDAAARKNIKSFLLEIADIEDNRSRAATAAGIRDRANLL